jgi:uncharacterized lipoprotein YddW (UPF0748 family)
MRVKRSVISLLLAILTLGVTAQEKYKFWTWGGYDPNRDWKAYLTQLKEDGFTGYIMGAPREGFEKVIPIARQVGVDIQAWMWIMNNGRIAKEHPEWLDYNQKGESIRHRKAYVDYYNFLNPAAKGVKEAIVEEVEIIASIEGLAGISLDYCRFVDAILPTSLWGNYGVIQDRIYPEWDYGYHPEMIEAFKKRYGYDPRSEKDPTADTKWHQFRMDKVNDVVAAIKEVTVKHGVEMTASPFPTPQMSRRMVYQDWGEWQLNRAFPMIYHGFYYGDRQFITTCVEEAVRDSMPGTLIYCGLYVPDFGAKSAFSIVEGFKSAMAGGAKGVSVFTYDGLSAQQRSELRQYIKSLK